MKVRTKTIALAALATAIFPAVPTSLATAYLTREQALVLAFGENAEVRRQSHFLTEDQLAAARDLAGPGVAIESALVGRYEGWRNGRLLGTAYFDTHTVRTLPETLMIVVSPEGTLARLEILSFGEPRDYLPGDRWMAQFPGRTLDSELAVDRGIHGITGATLSARAVTEASRRVLAIHRVVAGASP